MVGAASLAAGEGLTNAQVLQPFFAKLTTASGPNVPKRPPLHILQIGDSHTAGDQITGAWRETLQNRYGSGGRGVMAPGRPYDGYLTRGITASMSPGWSIAADFGKGWSDSHPPIGLSAFSMTSQSEGATMALDTDINELFSRFTICAMTGPGAGATTIRLGDQSQRMSWSSPGSRPECRTMHSPTPLGHVDLTTDGGPVTITSWATFADRGGIVVSNVGVVGSQLVHFGRTDDEVVGEEMKAYDPDLIVIAFGTNEAFGEHFSPFEYEAILRTQIGRVRRLAGNVPILLLGAPDALTARPALAANAPGDASACTMDPPVATPPPAPAASGGALATAMARLGGFLGISSQTEAGAAPAIAPPPTPIAPPPVSGAPPVAGRRPLFPPPALAQIRAIQKRVAVSLRVAYWDWEGRMGGRCTAMRWGRATPPLMRPDYVHYTRAGAQEIASRLEADLDRSMGYAPPTGGAAAH